DAAAQESFGESHRLRVLSQPRRRARSSPAHTTGLARVEEHEAGQVADAGKVRARKRHVVVAEDAALRGVACIEERVARIVDDVVATGAERGEEGGSRGLCACDRLDTTAGPVREELAHAIGLARGTCEVACGVLDE